MVALRNLLVLLVLMPVLLGSCSGICNAWFFWDDKQIDKVVPIAPGIYGPIIRVGLVQEKNSLDISSDSVIYVLDSSKNTIAQLPANVKLNIVAKDGQLKCNNTLFPDNISFSTKADDSKFSLIYNGHKYRGDFNVVISEKAGNKLIMNNNLPVEKYLYSVVGAEVSPAWPEEALKAQAIAARSYALYYLTGKKKYIMFDVLPDTSDQAYFGKSTEAITTRQAVDITRGQVVAYQGRVALTLFMASGGGRTASAEEVWGTKYPYLQSVVDYDKVSPYYDWKVNFSLLEVQKRLLAAGYDCGALHDVILSDYNQDSEPDCGDRTASGRVKLVVVIGDKRTCEISGNDMRKIFDLRSTLFAINVGVDGLEFLGHGWGHGIGLSQWGAKQLATDKTLGGNGASCQQILAHYYPGTVLLKQY